MQKASGIGRLQDASDIDVTLGAGVDGYTLNYDHDTGKFVLVEPVAAGSSALADCTDVNFSLGADVDEFAVCWDDDTSKFVLRKVAIGDFVLSDGSTVGASSQIQVFLVGVKSAKFQAGYDSPSDVLAWPVQVTGYSTTVMSGFVVRNTYVTIPSYSAVWASYQHDSATIGMIGPVTSSTGGLAFGGFSSANAAAIPLMFSGINGHTTPTAASVVFRAGKHNGTTGIVVLSASEYAAEFRNWTSPIMYVRGDGMTDHLISDAVANSVTIGLTVRHSSSGTPAAGFGVSQRFGLHSSTTVNQDAALVEALWYEATHASRKADLVISAYDTVKRECLRCRGAGSAAAIGFLGAAPSARVAHVADAKVDYAAGDLDTEGEVITAINTLNGKMNSILSTLETFGFHATS